MALTLALAVGGCASTMSDSERKQLAAQHALSLKECPEKQIVAEDVATSRFVLAGCESLFQVWVDCDRHPCVPKLESVSKLVQPVRLRSSDGKRWVDPAPEPPGPPPVEESNPSHKGTGGRRLSDINDLKHKPSIPRQLNHGGMVVWALYNVCVTAVGEVRSVSVVKSTLPERPSAGWPTGSGLDGFWISKIETWRYSPYVLEGKPVPFCHPARIEVHTASGSYDPSRFPGSRPP